MDKEIVQSFIDDVIAGELKSASDSFEGMMGDKVDNAIDQKKIEVAGRVFGESEVEITDELDDVDMGDDGDDFDAEE